MKQNMLFRLCSSITIFLSLLSLVGCGSMGSISQAQVPTTCVSSIGEMGVRDSTEESTGVIEMIDNNTWVDICEIKADYARQIEPQAYREDIAKQKGLIKKSVWEEDYLHLQALYLTALNYYLCNKGGLDEYQMLIDQDEHDFTCKKKSASQEISSFGRNNIYIRNNMYVEYLDNKDIELLKESCGDKGLLITDQLLQMIERTVTEVTAVRYETSTEIYDVIYDLGALGNNTAPNTNLVLEIAYDPTFGEDGNLVSREAEEEKDEFVSTLKMAMEQDMSEKLGIGVTVFVRN